MIRRSAIGSKLKGSLNFQSRRWLDNDFLNQSTDRGFLHFWGIKGAEELSLEGGNIRGFWGVRGLGPCRGYSVGRFLPVFPYLTDSQCESSAAVITVKL